MSLRIQSVAAFGIALAAVATATCSDKSSAPAAPTAITLTTPSPVSPAQGAQVSDLSQPVTLVVSNATSTGANALTYVFEVATDSAFANRVYSRTGVAAGSGGQTSHQIDRLSPGQSYFWRARAEDLTAVVVSAWTSAGFSVGPAVRFDAPAGAEPLNGDRAAGARPLFRVRNAVRDAQVGAVTYTFEVSETSDFKTVLTSGTANEGAGGYGGITEWRVPTNLTDKTYYWRAKGVSSAGSSPYMTAAAFRP